MKQNITQLSRYVLIGIGFGVIWATIQYINGQIQELQTLVSPVVVFGVVGGIMWCIRQLFVKIRNHLS